MTAPTRLAIAGWSLALLALVPVAARAEIYICKDGGGHTITSDRPVAECADRVMRVMSGGLVRREIAAPLTPEQRRQKQVEQDKLRADAVAAEEQRQLDRILLARYQSDLDIEAARKRALQPVQDLIAGSNQAIANAEKQHSSVKAESEFYQNKPLPFTLRRKQEEATRTIQNEQSNIQDQSATIDDINATYDAAMKRYRELRGSDASKPAIASAGNLDNSAKAVRKR
ncbi:DUF4124 domain-containing protein [Undibacterium arcticum]|uniref:DUF4124 domain-containing protein n=1 Tax=Undibacterium arcticum TaxID=1762892 RepID=UPI00361A5885